MGLLEKAKELREKRSMSGEDIVEDQPFESDQNDLTDFDFDNDIAEVNQPRLDDDSSESDEGLPDVDVHEIDDDADDLTVTNADASGFADSSVSGLDDFLRNADDSNLSAASSEEIENSRIDEDQSPLLWDAAREIIKTSSQAEFFNVLILLLMGQIEASTASIILPVKGDEQSKWFLKESRGTRLSSKVITFKSTDRILNDILTRKEIVDLREYFSDSSCREECDLFVSIDAQIAIPLANNGNVLAVVALGGKLSEEEYTESDFRFISELCQAAAAIYERTMHSEKLAEENRSLLQRGSEKQDIDRFEKEIRGTDVARVSSFIQEKMNAYGIESYAFFDRSERGDRFIPRFTEREDLATLRASSFGIDVTSLFCTHLMSCEEWEEFENPGLSPLLKDVFGDSLIVKMNIFIVHPFVVNGQLGGFVIIFRAKRDQLPDNRIHAISFARAVFSYMMACAGLYIDDSRFVEGIDRILFRLERSLAYAADLKIPVSAVMFSIKNIKRYYAIYGAPDARDLVSKFRTIIESRLATSDYAVRYDRGKILVIMPGKNKKYALPFANSIRNELVMHFRERESQIMLTYLTAEYPADGATLYDFLDYLD